MRIALFYHSLVSDWNHGNAHFLRGVVTELLARGHTVRTYEPERSWSRDNLLRDSGPAAVGAFRRAYPMLTSRLYGPKADIAGLCEGSDLIIAHEWNEPSLIAALGEYRRSRPGAILFFHDTHHRAATAPKQMAAYDLSGFDGALVYGRILAEIYLRRGWARNVWVWHEAADSLVFRPRARATPQADLVWIGNWGDDERSAELQEFLLKPIRDLKLSATIYGVRYPKSALAALRRVGAAYAGYIANYRVPQAFAAHRLTVHVPRRPYVKSLPGIPTIRPFESLACGIPLISSPWNDSERLFNPGDYLVAHDSNEMKLHIKRLLQDAAAAQAQASRGLATIRARHTCAHRVDQLLGIVSILRSGRAPRAATSRLDRSLAPAR